MKRINIFDYTSRAFKFKFNRCNFRWRNRKTFILIILMTIFIYTPNIFIIKLVLFKLRFTTDTGRINNLFIIYLFLLSQLLGWIIKMICYHSLGITKCNMTRILITSHHLLIILTSCSLLSPIYLPYLVLLLLLLLLLNTPLLILDSSSCSSHLLRISTKLLTCTSLKLIRITHCVITVHSLPLHLGVMHCLRIGNLLFLY